MSILTWWLEGGSNLKPAQVDAIFRRLTCRRSKRLLGVGSHFGVTIQLEENQRFNRKRVFENIHLN